MAFILNFKVRSSCFLSVRPTPHRHAPLSFLLTFSLFLPSIWGYEANRSDVVILTVAPSDESLKILIGHLLVVHHDQILPAPYVAVHWHSLLHLAVTASYFCKTCRPPVSRHTALTTAAHSFLWQAVKLNYFISFRFCAGVCLMRRQKSVPTKISLEAKKKKPVHFRGEGSGAWVFIASLLWRRVGFLTSKTLTVIYDKVTSQFTWIVMLTDEVNTLKNINEK
jgi:hypothetical protein